MKILKILAAVGVTATGFVGLTAAQAQQEANPQGPVCTVTLQRDQPGGVFDVTRQVFEDGACNCFVYTGPEGQPRNVAARVAGVVNSQRCPGARPMRVRGPGSGAGAGAGNAACLNAVVPVGLFAGAAAGVVILIEDDEGVSP